MKNKTDWLLMCNLFHNLPRYIVQCSKDVQPSAYLQINDVYNLQCIANPERKKKTTLKPFHCLREANWPKKEELGLDDSQMKALQLALTKELAIIQGPPGTGEALQSATTILLCLWSLAFLKDLASRDRELISFASHRKNIHWPEDCSGSAVQWEAVERWFEHANACGVLHKPRPGSVPGG